MSGNKPCEFCKKPTADEIIKGEVFCVECGHKRGVSKASICQGSKKKAEYWNSWWYIGIWLLVCYFIFPTLNNFIKSNNKTRTAQQTEMLKKISVETQRKAKDNLMNLSKDDINEMADLMRRARQIIANNLKEQDSVNFLRITTSGRNLTFEEETLLYALVQKSKNSMSLAEKNVVEAFEEKTKSLLK